MTTPPPIRRSWREGPWLPLAIAAVVGFGAVLVTWRIVQHDVRRWSGELTFNPELKFVAVISSLAAAIAFYVARRLLRGPSYTRAEWVLTVPRIEPRATGYRDAAAPTVHDLVERLRGHGYQPRVVAIDDVGAVIGPAELGAPLAGVALHVAEPRLGAAPIGVALRLSPRTESGSGLAMIEACYVRGEGCRELAQFVIAELDVLVPGITYKASDSALSSDPASELRAVLPRKPRLLA